jgi:YfiH family protein
MITTRASIPAAARGMLVARFPGVAAGARADTGAAEPLAILSLASQGSMRHGDPDCAANRERFLSGVGIDPINVRSLSLVHSRAVVFPEGKEDCAVLASRAGGADGIVLSDPSLAAAVTVADCMPIWLLDRGSGAFGILHSGWRGTGILGVAIRAVARRLGSDPSTIAVILGPAIGSCCYAVDEERAEAFAAEHGELSVSRKDGRWRLDLRSANVSIAEREGVGSLLSIEACTSCDPRLGSFRREGPDSFTRMLALCGAAPVSPNLLLEASEPG